MLSPRVIWQLDDVSRALVISTVPPPRPMASRRIASPVPVSRMNGERTLQDRPAAANVMTVVLPPTS